MISINELVLDAYPPWRRLEQDLDIPDQLIIDVKLALAESIIKALELDDVIYVDDRKLLEDS